jgi:hypothetical protein
MPPRRRRRLIAQAHRFPTPPRLRSEEASMSEMMAPVEGEQIVDALASTEAGKPDASGAMELVKYDAACRALAEARSADEVKHVRDIAMAIRLCAKQAKNKDLAMRLSSGRAQKNASAT